MKKIIPLFFLLCFSLSITSFVLLPGQPACAQEWESIESEMRKVGETGFAQYDEPEPPAVIIGRIIQVALGLLGILFIALITYGGFLWMTSGGSEEKIKKAKSLIVNGVIGLIIAVAAYTVSYFVIQALVGDVLR